MNTITFVSRAFAIQLACLIMAAGLTHAAETSHAAVFNVRDYGAVGDGTNLDNAAINKAIEAAAQTGGGTVLVPAGTYLCGSIHLRSNIHLLIDAGAAGINA